MEFETTEDALSAVDNMHYAELLGSVITCTVAKPTASTRLKPGSLISFASHSEFGKMNNLWNNWIEKLKEKMKELWKLK